jgi:hypothetical protein
MTDVPIHDVDREIVAWIAIPALCQEDEIPLPVKARTRGSGDWAPSWGPAKAKHTANALAARLGVRHILSIMIILFAGMPPDTQAQAGKWLP